MSISTRNINVATLVLAAIAIGAVLYVLRSILVPFVIAGFISILFRPLITLLRKWHVPTAISLLIVLVICAAAFWGIGTIVSYGVENVAQKSPLYAERIQHMGADASAWLKDISVRIFGTGLSVDFAQLINLSSITSTVSPWLGGVLGIITDAVLVLLFVVLLVLGVDVFPQKLSAAFRDVGGFDSVKIYLTVNEKVLRYLRVKTVFNLLNALCTWLILSLFSVDFAPLLSLLAFLFLFLPNIGSLICSVFIAGVTLVQFESAGYMMLVVGVIVVVQNIFGNVIEPKVMGYSLDLSPVVVLFSMLFWGWMWGIVGMILSVPIMAIITTVMENFPTTRPVAIMMRNQAPKPETVA
ncbi:MAG: AI-2E family transporter [Ignavibacteria bacterium]|nr:AI-2E family transporter [Ignavibacteria bacterium]